jgi:hypothetical protein
MKDSFTNREKAIIAEHLIRRVGDLFDDETFAREVDEALFGPGTDLDNEVRDQVAAWMIKLPGTAWDVRLGHAAKN